MPEDLFGQDDGMAFPYDEDAQRTELLLALLEEGGEPLEDDVRFLKYEMVFVH